MTDEKENQLKNKIADAYQVIGHITMVNEPVSEAEQIRALDYFSDPDSYDEDFLPWPRKQTKTG